ncbi:MULTISPECIES: heptaprenyl diphosphate synthase component II [Bacillaceae]|jgi:heptaprenyl diphosphate synthase|uniref:heptaprenyl diphosphate synthase component II n=1 Tax=Bacillaceae TaxID=186817 RepID=UPI000D54C02E|nr:MULTISPECIES: heptaprenyl diphosphate synthase component II [Bacillaceae]MCB5933800.1 heptaprenyl diphosphate synthase component II [Bacillus sp. DFI.2.34]AWI12695.1 heptaprenyl diphosphate synthase component II [Caldibacillus thermoamylovorans]MBU5342702.1 heptaprenyl diphosphate synthase component II [Caldifermentibacillus hisashii]MCB7070043.1 heptaprenyl diphosphate synthase component II [Caldibacillus sp. 210928-DFI.2.22]MCB7073511.1 heptaprenyl diphosphate synthase component II [Caldi
MNYKTVYTILNNDLKKIENELEYVLDAHSQLLKESSLHYLQAGGKRIRPVFVLLSAKFGNYNFQIVKDVAVSLELIHMASLIHDDVIDDAYTRRGRPTVKAKWDNKISMYTGDYILARALEIITSLNNVEAHKILSKTMVELSIGEIEQIRDKYNFEQTITNYFRRIKRKTALLIAASCQLGGIAADVPRDVHIKLAKFGYYAGMAFQITDDILDFTSTEAKLGKPAGEDLLQGNITLPVLLAIKNPDVKSQIEKVNEYMDSDELSAIIELIKNTGAINKAMQISNLYLQKANQVLNVLPPNPTKKLLGTMLKFIGKRNF